MKEIVTIEECFKRFAPCFNFEKNEQEIINFLIEKGYAIKINETKIQINWDKVPKK